MSEADLQTKSDTPGASPGFLLWQVTNKWQARQREALAQLNLTHVQFVLLASLVWLANKDGVTQKQLAGFTQTDLMMTSQVVRKLEQKGFLTRVSHVQDRRALLLTPTPAGRSLANKAIKVVEAADNDFFATLGKNSPSFIAHLHSLANQAN